ncbi:MAG: hypothetical protein H7A35_01470 [Planctomycetales bacterium]|nr:hypothetical protein [bacterium]UNM08727.1 MAG: hypothetical protein H7A35_01470 [Planctomycetales bacterium]
MRFNRTRIYLLMLLLMPAVLASCGAGGGSAVSSLDVASQPSHPLQDSAALADGLPALDQLPEPSRSAMLSGPGYFPVPVLEQGVMLQRSGSVMSGPQGIELDGSAGEAWVLFGVYGFDGDSQPNSVMAEATDVQGSFHIGVTHYASGRWEWSAPFTGDEEHEYEHVAQYTVADQYVSERGYHYIAVLAPEGSSLLLSGLQLGVDGGDNAPVAPDYFEISNGDAGFHFWWYPSPDHDDPDFAGYTMQRALWPGTDFQDLGPLSHETFYHDAAADPALLYRYRVRVADVSGNSSWGYSNTPVSVSGDNYPVPALEMPAGPLYGGQMVTFDLSGSYDPDGEPLTEYTVQFDNTNGMGGVGPLTSTDPLVSVLLQPGCYVVQAAAKSTVYCQPIVDTLKIYPAWQPEPQLVAEPGSGQWRMQSSRSIYWQQGDAIVTFFNDYLGPGLGALVQHADGSREILQVPYYLYDIDWISEPVVWQGQPYVGVVSDNVMLLAAIGVDGLQWVEGGLGYTGFVNIDLVVDGEDQLRVCTLNEYNPGDFEVLAINAGNPLDIYTLEFMSNSDGPFDVEWNPEYGGFELIYTTVGSIHWNRTDEEGGLVDNDFVGAGIFDSLDMELHADGSPGVMGRSGGSFVYFSYDEGTASWSAPEVIEPAGLNGKSGDLLFDGNDMAAFFGLAVGQSSLYRRNGGSWDPQTVNWALLSGQHCAIAQWPDGRVNIIDGTVGGAIFISDFNEDGSHPAPIEVPSVSWDGIDLNAVAGADGIHAVWRGDNGAIHYIADNDGTNWNASTGFVSSDALELMADENGKVFVGNTHGATADLFSWFGGAWLIEGSSNRWGSSLPYLAAQRDAPGGQFIVQDDLPVPPALRHMHDDGGGFLVFDSYDFDTIRIDEGVSLFTGAGLISFVRGDEILGSSGLVGFISADDHSYAHQIHDYLYTSSVDLTRGRRMDACNYLTGPSNSHSAFWVSGLEDGAPGVTRFQGKAYNGKYNVDSNTALADPVGIGAGQMQHTLSAAQAWGLTAVAISDQFGGEQGWLEWSNFGEFESLALPPIDMQYTMMHELVVGADGRWHIIYRDKRDGAIYAISTT